LCLAAVVLWTGCIAYHPQPLEPEKSEAALRARSAQDPGLADFVRARDAGAAWPPTKFDLTALTFMALYFQPDIEMARARVRSAQAAEITEGARPNPTLSVLPTRVVSSFPDEPPWMMAASLDVPIETAGKRSKRLEQAREATRAARLALSETSWSVRAKVRAALVEYIEARAELGLFREEAAETETWSRMLAGRLAAGDISRFDLTLAQNETLNAQLAFQAAQTRVATAKTALSAAVGVTAAGLEGMAIEWSGFDQPPTNFDMGRVQEIGLTHRLDVQRALAEYASVEAALKLAVAQQYPDIHLDPGYEFDQGEHKFSLGPSITLPVLDRNRGPIAEGLARRDESAAAFLSLQSDAIHQMEAAQVDYGAAVEAWRATDRIAGEVQKRLEVGAERELEAGETDRATVLQARLQRSAALRARLAAARKVQDALGELENAVQQEIKN